MRPRHLALALLALPAGALAQSGYSVSLEAAPPQKMMVKEVQWTCAGSQCTAARAGTSSDLNVCRAVARKLGRVSAFTAAERRFETADLEKCNAS